MNAESLSEILQVEVAAWSTALGIYQDVIIITDEAYWLKVFKPKVSKKRILLGGASSEYGYIFVNINKISTYKEFLQTIIHELLHIRYPKMPEQKIMRLEKQYVW